jgi:uncharacterized membrane protein YccC
MASRTRTALFDGALLAVASLVTWVVTTELLSRAYFLSRDDDLLGGMWAVIATVFVVRDSVQQSTAAAVTRMSATLVSFVLCLAYLIFLPFNPFALALLVGASALIVVLLGRPGDAITAGITTTVVMVVAAISPQNAWQQPILRFVDTVVGVAVGVGAAWLALTLRSRVSTARPSPEPGL